MNKWVNIGKDMEKEKFKNKISGVHCEVGKYCIMACDKWETEL